MNRNDTITGKIICLDRGTAKENAGDDSDRHLILVGGVLAIPKDHAIARRVIEVENSVCVGLLAGYDGNINLHYLEDLPSRMRGDLSKLILSYKDWRV